MDDGPDAMTSLPCSGQSATRRSFGAAPSSWSPGRAWVAVVALTVVVMTVSTVQSLARYEEFRSGLSWDLAYYNQWYWAVTHGEGQITVRPGSAYASEGPSVWKTNYLAPIRFALMPVYALFPGPRTLLVLHAIIFWCVIPAAYTLVRSESGSNRLACAAAVLVPMTALTWLLAWNDFRELQLAVPFALWAIQGWRERNRAVTTAGIVGLLACRQEFALTVMSLSLLPARRPEVPARRRAWTVAALVIGLFWGVLFLAYLGSSVDPHAPASYLVQFTAASSTAADTISRPVKFLWVGLAPWTVLALFAPRVALLAIPWTWVLSSGHWEMQTISTRAWHHVRYAAPMTAIILGAGLVGFARASSVLRRVSRFAVPALWALTAVGLMVQSAVLLQRFAEVPRVVASAEAVRLWSLIDQVAPDDGVLAASDMTAPLSSRRSLYSYELPENRPPGYPRLPSTIRWAFVRAGDLPESMFLAQGFDKVHDGPSFHVFRRTRATGVSQQGGGR